MGRSQEDEGGSNNRELEHHSACINQTGQPSPFGVTARIDLFGRSLGGITQRRRRRPYLILLRRRREGKSNDRGSVFERRAADRSISLLSPFFLPKKCTARAWPLPSSFRSIFLSKKVMGRGRRQPASKNTRCCAPRSLGRCMSLSGRRAAPCA